jgi:hypothetical protein
MEYSVFSIQSSVLYGRIFKAFDQSREHSLDFNDLCFELGSVESRFY